MSSPPPSQPPTNNTPNPLKRASTFSQSSNTPGTSQGNAHKRPRMHPLRQTSFPSTVDADLAFTQSAGGAGHSRTFSAAASDAGSVTGSFTGSLGGGDGSVPVRVGKKRGRKSKAEKEREREREEMGSVSGGREGRVGSVDGEGSVRGAGAGGGGGGAAGAGAEEGGDEDEDYEDEGELLGREEGAMDTETEKKNLAMLVDAFNPQQSERYDLFKRAKLRKETLRRIVNHALSQSVPASVVTTINGFTKVFAGEIIEKARTVQLQWAEAHDQAYRAAYDEWIAASGADISNDSASGGEAPQVPGQERPQHQAAALQAQAARFQYPPNPHRGQLLPAHLREALRRYKRDGEGGGVGFSGLSMGNLGVRGSVTWNAGGVGGRRIFR